MASIVFLELGIQVADEIIGVGFVGDELGDVFEGGDAVCEVAEIFVGEAEVVPGVGIVGELLWRRRGVRRGRLRLFAG